MRGYGQEVEVTDEIVMVAVISSLQTIENNKLLKISQLDRQMRYPVYISTYSIFKFILYSYWKLY